MWKVLRLAVVILQKPLPVELEDVPRGRGGLGGVGI